MVLAIVMASQLCPPSAWEPLDANQRGADPTWPSAGTTSSAGCSRHGLLLIPKVRMVSLTGDGRARG